MTSRFLPDIAPAAPAATPPFIRAARAFILLGVWTLVAMAALASWLVTAR